MCSKIYLKQHNCWIIGGLLKNVYNPNHANKNQAVECSEKKCKSERYKFCRFMMKMCEISRDFLRNEENLFSIKYYRRIPKKIVYYNTAEKKSEFCREQ